MSSTMATIMAEGETHQPSAAAAMSEVDQSLSLGSKEAVAALSATLAFRRFENHPLTNNYYDQNNNAGDHSNVSGDYYFESSASGSSSQDPMDDSLKRLSTILSRNGHGGVLARRASLETIMSGISRNSSSDQRLKRLSSSLTAAEEPYQMDGDVIDNDNISLDSDDLQVATEGREGEESMTISLLEKKKLPPNYNHLEGTTASDSDSNTSCDNSASNSSIDLEYEGEKKQPAHRGLVSSLHRIFDTSKGSKSSKKAQQSRSSSDGRSSSQESNKLLTSNGSSLSWKSNNNKNSFNNSLSWKRTFSTATGTSRSNNHSCNDSYWKGVKKKSPKTRYHHNHSTSWKDEASSPESCLKHPPLSEYYNTSQNNGYDDDMGTSPTSITDNNNNNSLVGFSRQRTASRAKARVSWQIDDDDMDLNFGSTSRPGYAKQGSPSSSTVDHQTKQHAARPLSNSLMSEDTGSIDLEAAMSSTASKNNGRRKNRRSGLACSLKADEELLQSMIQIANLSNSMASGSTWGNHASLTELSVQNRRISDAGGEGENEADVAAVEVAKKEALAFREPPDEIDVEETIAGEGSCANNRSEHVVLGNATATITASTAAAVTRLAYQEVEDYRTRLQRKRATIDAMERQSSATASSEGDEAENQEDLNHLLLENATNISNALLLQRALYTLRIHNNDGVMTSMTNSGDDSAAGADSDPPSNQSSNIMPRAHSEHTGIKCMALNHFLGLSSSGTSDPVTPSASQPNASWTLPSNNNTTTNLQPTSRSNNNSNPFSAFLQHRRRNTFQEGPELQQQLQHQQEQPRQPSMPQIGAYQSNEPAPLLIRRTFESAGPQNRRESRAEARRRTLDRLARERAAAAALAPTFSNDIFDSSDSTIDTTTTTATRTRSDSLNGNGAEGSPRHNNSEITRDDAIRNGTTTTSTAASTTSPNDIDTRTATSRSSFVGGGRRSTSICGSLLRASVRPQLLVSSTNTNDSNNSNSNYEYGFQNQSLRSMLRTSAIQSSKRMLHAVLVSDEIVEADHIETINNDTGIGNSLQTQYDVEMAEMVPTLQERLAMMEGLLEERDEEQHKVLQMYKRRERVWWTLLVLSVIIIVVLIILIVARMVPLEDNDI